MSLEQAIEKLSGQFDRFFATLGDKAPATAAAAATAGETETAATTPARGRGRPPKTKALTMDDAKAAAFRVKDAINADEAKRIIKAHGAPDLAKLKPEVFAAFIADCESAIEAAGSDESSEDEL